VAPGVQATVVPTRPWFSIFNAVVYEDREALREALDELGGLYRKAGVGAWSVWVRPGDEEAMQLLSAQGHTEEGAPLAMGALLRDLDVAPRRELVLSPSPSWTDVARC